MRRKLFLIIKIKHTPSSYTTFQVLRAHHFPSFAGLHSKLTMTDRAYLSVQASQNKQNTTVKHPETVSLLFTLNCSYMFTLSGACQSFWKMKSYSYCLNKNEKYNSRIIQLSVASEFRGLSLRYPHSCKIVNHYINKLKTFGFIAEENKKYTCIYLRTVGFASATFISNVICLSTTLSS